MFRPSVILKGHNYGDLKRRCQVLNRLIRETGLPRWHIKKRAAGFGLTLHQDKRPWTTPGLLLSTPKVIDRFPWLS
ncbi:MAG: hypothetical protein ACRD18_06090 [Terriglobia bacterium]